MVDTSRMRTSLLLALLVIAAPAPAFAGGIVLESYTGQRPADADRLLGPVLDELARHDFLAGNTVARSIESQVSRPAVLPQGVPGNFATDVERGQRAWAGGRFDEAVQILTPLVEAARNNPGAFAGKEQLREALHKALVALALSQHRMGDPTAGNATLDELVRAFPDTDVARSTYGPDAAEMFAQAKKRVTSGGRGKLTVDVRDPRATVYIDEHFQSVGGTSASLPPGEYRVLVESDRQLSRSHRVVVRAGAETKVAIEPGLDRALHTSAPWTGLLFTAESDRDALEALYAKTLAIGTNATAVAIVGIDQVKGRPAVVGALVSLSTGREIRRASVAMDPDPSTQRLQALAKYLAGEDAAPGIDVLMPLTETKDAVDPPHDRAAERVEPPRRSGRWGGWKWLVGGTAVAALGTGITLVALDGGCSLMPTGGRPCNDFYQTKTPGWIVVGGGALLAGTTIFLFATEHGNGTTRAAAIAPARGGALVSISGTF
jgi:hypothetical protein